MPEEPAQPLPAGIGVALGAPGGDGLLVEDKDGPYVCNIVTNEKNANDPWVKPFVETYQQPEIAKWILEKYKGIVIPAF